MPCNGNRLYFTEGPNTMSDKKLQIPLFIILFVMLAATPVIAQDTSSLQWELVNPFRFIRNQDVVDDLKDIYKQLPADQKTAYGLERKLQDLSENQVKERRAAAADCDNPKLDKPGRRKCFEPYLGWF